MSLKRFKWSMLNSLIACLSLPGHPVTLRSPFESLNYAAPAFKETQNPSKSLISGWSSEKFALPPGFAPSLPVGTESLRFAPGWNKPEAEGFWSYAFVMRIEEPKPDAERVDSLLETYYNGLLKMFAEGKHDIGAAPARVELTQVAVGRYVATMRTIDAFATFKPIEIRLLVETFAAGPARSSLRIQLSPQPEGHPVWKALGAAIGEILAEEARVSDPMARFSGMTKGRWKTTYASGHSVLDTWSWGPGRQSIRSMTTGTAGNGDPWNVITAYYWHPVRKEVRSLTVTPYSRGTGEGAIVFDGKSASGEYDMFQSREPRNLAVRWTFEGPDLYRDSLLERTARGVEPLMEWRRIRVSDGEKIAMPARAKPPKPSTLLKPLTGLLGVWESSDKGGRMEFRYIPDADMIIGRLTTIDVKKRQLVTDLYFYHHTGKGKLRWLGLSVDPQTRGAVVTEGDVTPAGGRKLNFDFKDHRDSGTTDGKQSIEFDPRRTLRYRVWPSASGNHKPTIEFHFKKETSTRT